jgi:uncharacterized YigZ family protein
LIESYRTPAEAVTRELEKVKGSRFLADLAPVPTAEAALARIDGLRRQHHDARHHCWAYRLGPQGEDWRSSDDGEPSGTAGRPILDQLEGHALTFCALVVTRWFGGVKLGAGNLARAYGAAAAGACESARVRVVRLTRRVRVVHPYDCAGAVQGLLSAIDLAPTDAEYGADVRLALDVPVRDVDRVLRELVDRTAGRARVDLLEE